jgi:hypothetical protein
MKIAYRNILLFTTCSFSLLNGTLEYVTSDTIITPELREGAIIRDEFPGFKVDFLVLHCLMKKYAPKKIFEVGTCDGDGILVITHATPHSSVITLELPPYTPPYNLTPERIGHRCNRPYTQVIGDSLTYNYAQHFPLDAWFIDGAHDYEHVKHETEQAVQSQARLIVYHDTDIKEVFEGVIDGLQGTDYKIFRVADSRITYAIK